MRVCVTSAGASLESAVDPRFGRCRYFVFVDTETMAFEAFENGSAVASGGAGVQSARFVADRGASVVLTGNVGPNAFETLNAAGVRIVTGMAGLTVSKAVEKFSSEDLSPASGPTAGSHSGLRR